MLPILIMPGSVLKPEVESLPEPSESAAESTDLPDFPELREIMGQPVRREKTSIVPLGGNTSARADRRAA